MSKHVQNIFDSIVTSFISGKIAESVAMACFPCPEAPSSSWSFTNRTIMFLSGTGDARGYQQWKAIDRYVKKGSDPIHILAPCFKKEIDEKSGKEKRVLSHFDSVPVFRYEDTNGEELKLKSFEVPTLRMKDWAKKWEIPLQEGGSSYRFYNYYSSNRKKPSAASPGEVRFFWALAKEGQKQLQNGNGQGPFQDAVKDLCGQAICSIVGKKTDGEFKGSFQQIDFCAKEANKSIRYSCLYVLSEVERILNLIFNGGKPLSN